MVLEHRGSDGRTYRAMRFTAYGKRRYVSFGPVTKAEAERELRHVLADVKRGLWRPAQVADAPLEPEPLPTFHEYAEDWWLRHKRHLRPKTQSDYRWRLEKHLLPFFKDHMLDDITFDTVERYIAPKLAEYDPLSARPGAATWRRPRRCRRYWMPPASSTVKLTATDATSRAGP